MHRTDEPLEATDGDKLMDVTSNNEKRSTLAEDSKSAVSAELVLQTSESQRCSNGVCMVSWKPQRPAA